MLYSLLRAFFWLLLRAIFAVLGGMRVVGRENVPRCGPVIITPNHLSHVDPALVGVALPRAAYYMATDELFAIPVLGRLARWMRGYPIIQDSPDRAALRRTENLLKAGEAVVIFPEGHESVTGELQPLQGGPILIAMRTGAPIVPVRVVGTEKIMPPRTWRLRHAGRRIEVRFGRPLSVEELTGGLKGRAGVDHGVQILFDAIQALHLDLIPDAPCAAKRTVGSETQSEPNR